MTAPFQLRERTADASISKTTALVKQGQMILFNSGAAQQVAIQP